MFGNIVKPMVVATLLLEMLENQFVSNNCVCKCCKTNGFSNIIIGSVAKTAGLSNVVLGTVVKTMVLATFVLIMLSDQWF